MFLAPHLLSLVCVSGARIEREDFSEQMNEESVKEERVMTGRR